MSDAATPTTRQWTAEQAAAIAHRQGNLLVSASAGSGKTAVLTERVLQLVTGRDAEKTPLDRLLIVTFTEKAAREMRVRIEGGLIDALEDPAATGDATESARLALDALPGAWIMTIDAFCRRVVVEHFHLAGLAPDPRVPDAAELARLEQETIDGLLEEWAADRDRRAQLTALIAGTARGSHAPAEQIRALMRFLESLDDPQSWLHAARERIELTLRADRADALPEAYAAAPVFAAATRELATHLRDTTAASRARSHDADKVAVWDGLADHLDAMADAAPCFRPDALRTPVAERFDPILGKLVNKGVCGGKLYADKSFLATTLARFVAAFDDWRARWFAMDEAGLLFGAQLAARRADSLLALAAEALDRLDRRKRRRGWAGFNDFERQALNILSDPHDPSAPSAVAHALREQFRFVLVDEFQDTSPLQHRIVTRVASPDDPGNLFVVGDYKQSIYRFRYADPELFLRLMQSGGSDDESDDETGDAPEPHFDHRRLARNFRSRPGILAFINAVFERLMDPAVGEIDYRDGEQLDPDRRDADSADPVCVEARWLVGNAERGTRNAENEEDDPEKNDESSDTSGRDPQALRGVEAQAAWVARRIRELTRDDAPYRPGDCAILLRNLKGELDTWVAALDREGLKARTQGIDPLQTATEMLDLVAALRVADNPLQDVPLATVMRSPLGGFDDDDLLRIRLIGGGGPFHEALWRAAGHAAQTDAADKSDRPAPDPDLTDRLKNFMERLDRWRRIARERPAEDVLDAILNDTAYAAWLSGQPNARRRLDNLAFLRGVVRRLAATTAGDNPLATFVEQVERAIRDAERIAELPEPVGDPGDAVHLLTIHGAKGLEFPVVFLPRLDRRFHIDKKTDMLLDRRRGIALVGIDADRRRQYPTLAHRALGDERRRRERSEELRLHYVAMTRAKERLILVGQIRDRDSLRQHAARLAELGQRPLAAPERLQASSPLDLIGPLIEWLDATAAPRWLNVAEIPPIALDAAPPERPALADALARDGNDPRADWHAAVAALRGEAAGIQPPPATPAQILPTIDPARVLTRLPAKTTVTALRRRAESAPDFDVDLDRESEAFDDGESIPSGYRRQIDLSARVPRWAISTASAIDDKTLDGPLRGAVIHEVLARVPLQPAPTLDSLRAAAQRALARRGLADSDAILKRLNLESMLWFFTTPEGRSMIERPRTVSRELPLTARKAVADFDMEAHAAFPAESILMQGIADVVIDEGKEATLLDYKTDWIAGDNRLPELREHYRLQVELYARAIESIWRVDRVRAGLVFLEAGSIEWIL